MRRFIVAALASIALLESAGAARADDRPYAVPFTPEWAAPQLEARPYGGPPGSQVQISGAKFHQAVRVFYGDQPMPIVARGKRYVIAIIPRYVRHDDFIYVVDNTGRARTRVPFDVITREPWRYQHYHW